MIDNTKIRKSFPVANQITYFDSAALVLKPQVAIDAMTNFYQNISISSRTADTSRGNLVNQTIIKVRKMVANLLDGQTEEIIFTSGTTESINLFCYMYQEQVGKGDVILVSAYNHSSNIIPWLELGKRSGAQIIISENLIDDYDKYKPKLVSISHETNNFHIDYDLDLLLSKTKQDGVILFCDAAQSISHQKVSLDVFDVIVFSTNKFYGPTGMGVLAVKSNLLKNLKPAKFGGGSVSAIQKNGIWIARNGANFFEPGTPDIAGFFMFEKSLEFFNSVGYEQTQAILTDLSNYLHKKLSELKNVALFSKPGDFIALINVKDVNAQDVATYLGTKEIYTIAGIFCAPYLRNIKDSYSYLRISLGIYNNYEDVDKLVEAIANGGDFYAF